MLERIIDIAAAELGIDPAEMRRRNFLRPDEFPYTTVMRTEYDSGDYDTALTEALRVAGYDELRREQAERRARGDRVALGIGVSAYVEITAGGGGAEFGSVTVNDDGTATIRVGTSAHGQGHATSFAMIVADRLQIPLDHVHFIDSDTAEVPRAAVPVVPGRCSSAAPRSPTRPTASSPGRVEVAATMLEANPDDIVVMEGGVGVAGVPTSALSWARLAEQEPISAVSDFEQVGATFPFGAHVAVVEVDLDTGRVTPIRHVAVDDCGRILNPMIVAGQQHGGIAQGIAQALWERYVYDDDGNPLTSTLTDYAMPSAAELPSFEASNTETPIAAQRAGREGHRRVGHDWLHTGRAECRRRHARASRGAPHRHPVHVGTGLERDPLSRGGPAAVAVARTSGDLREPRRPRRPCRRRRDRHLMSIVPSLLRPRSSDEYRAHAAHGRRSRGDRALPGGRGA